MSAGKDESTIATRATSLDLGHETAAASTNSSSPLGPGSPEVVETRTGMRIRAEAIMARQIRLLQDQRGLVHPRPGPDSGTFASPAPIA